MTAYGTGGMAPGILTAGRKAPGFHWIGGWVTPVASLVALEWRGISFLCRASNRDFSVIHPVFTIPTTLSLLPSILGGSVVCVLFYFISCDVFVSSTSTGPWHAPPLWTEPLTQEGNGEERVIHVGWSSGMLFLKSYFVSFLFFEPAVWSHIRFRH